MEGPTRNGTLQGTNGLCQGSGIPGQIIGFDILTNSFDACTPMEIAVQCPAKLHEYSKFDKI